MDQSIIDKIGKLLNTQGRTPEESAAYVAKAQELMREHDLTMESVQAHVDKRTGAGIGIVQQERQTLRKKGKPGSWKVDLFVAVAQTSDCWSYVSTGQWWDSTGYMIGREQDVQMAMYTYQFLVRELERMQDEFGKERWAELKETARVYGVSTHTAEKWAREDGRHPLRAKESWIKGAVISVIRALREAKAERDHRSAADSALVVNKTAEKRDWLARERGFANDAEYQADLERRRAEARANAVEVAEPKPLTKREREAMDRRHERARAKAERDYQREAARLDGDAYSRGLDDGKRIRLRPGVESGDSKEVPMLG